jgi:hypothetical protein
MTPSGTLRVIALYISPDKGPASTPVSSFEVRPNYGVVGDRHTGVMRTRSNGQVVPNLRHFTAITPQELGTVAEALGVPYIDPAWINANMVVAFDGPGPLTATLEFGARLCDASGTAIFQVEGAVEPCLEAGEIIASHFPDLHVRGERFPKCAIGRRGIYGVALVEATIRQGDVLTVQQEGQQP